MRRRALLVDGLLVAAALAVLPACQDTATILPSRNLSRPADVAFACLGLFAAGATPDGTPVEGGFSGRPMTECHLQGAVDPPAGPTRQTYAFVSNTERGELAVVDLGTGRLVDLEPAAPGYTQLPVGLRPESIAASADGCRLVTANGGGCDLSFVDPAAALADVARSQNGKVPLPSTAGAVTRVVPRTAKGVPLRAHAGEIVFLPGSEVTLPDAERAGALCSPAGQWTPPPAAGGPAGHRPWRALVTFPGCDLVATLELPSGTITSSFKITAAGLVSTGDEPDCPVECGLGAMTVAVDAERAPAAAAAAVEPDAGADGADPADDGGLDGGGAGPGDGGRSDTGLPDPPLPARLGVSALALMPQADRIYVGASGAPFITALDLVDDRLVVPGRPGPDGRIALAEGAIGVTRLRLTVDAFAGEPGRGVFVGERGRFLYAFARDGSIRVIELPADVTGRERECDTQVDPLALAGREGLLTSPCFALDDPAGPPPRRRPLALGPGVRLPVSLPLDVSFASLVLPGARDETNAAVNGAFGFVVTTNGGVYLLNLDPTTRMSEAAPPMTHSFRNAGTALDLAAAGGGPPRLDVAPLRSQVDLRVPLTPEQGPRLEGVPLTSPFDNPRASPEAAAPTWALFPDKTAASPMAWTLGWEAPLPDTTRYSGIIRVGAPAGSCGAGAEFSDGAEVALCDLGADFCRSGVVPGDVVQLLGCTKDADCGLGLACVTSPEAPADVTGLCLPREALSQGIALHCRAHLITKRRYTVLAAGPTRLELEPRRDEIARPTGFACKMHADCRQMQDRDRADFECVKERGKTEADPGRCLQPCDPAAGKCRPGTLCQPFRDGNFCAEAPTADIACYPMLAHYNVLAGHAFLVEGSSLPRFDTARVEGGRCVPWNDPVQITLRNRIPLAAPPCSVIKDPDNLAGEPLASDVAIKMTPSPNPCLFVGPNSDVTGSSPPKILFQNPHMRFLLTNVDTAFGESMQIRFEVHGGFGHTAVAKAFDLSLALPVRIVTGPTVARLMGDADKGYVNYPHVFVVDEGRLSSAGSHGRFLRINTAGSSGSTGLPVFDDLRSAPPFLVE